MKTMFTPHKTAMVYTAPTSPMPTSAGLPAPRPVCWHAAYACALWHWPLLSARQAAPLYRQWPMFATARYRLNNAGRTSLVRGTSRPGPCTVQVGRIYTASSLGTRTLERQSAGKLPRLSGLIATTVTPSVVLCASRSLTSWFQIRWRYRQCHER